ncbi:MAG: ABC transporter ATP-binding protein [Spirochaetaceae bacterium]|nr:ABC transporter ATP-binding protein [Spirochaetaceae bacterium]
MSAEWAGPVVLAEGLERSYEVGEEKVLALRGVSIRIERGDMTAIMGPSGSGKSTLMHLIGCLDSPTGGRILIDGVEAQDMSQTELARLRRERIGFVFQTFNLLPRLSILENAALPLRYAGVPNRLRLERAAAALEAVGLGDRTRHRPGQLSGGQRQRAAIARALINEPALILADEPTGALDQTTGRAILDLFRDINERGTTIVMVTHDPAVAASCRSTIRLRDGLIEEAGPTAFFEATAEGDSE